MKKLTRVIFIIALLAMVVLPLSARKAMNVSWEWLLSDPDVTAYRYQLNGEAEDGWTVVDGKTSVYTATGLDPYSDYTLYLQCSYDGINWSESASSTAYALLKLEEEVPAVEAEEKAEETVFYVYGFGISNRWTKSSFESTTLDDSILTSDEILGFIQYEAARYPEFVNSVYYSLIDNGFALTFEEGSVDVASLLPQYRSDITEYIDSLLVSLAETLEETAEEAVEAVLDTLVEESAEEAVFEETFDYRGLRADLKLYSTYGTVVLPAGTTEADTADAAALLVMKYPEASLVTYTFSDGVLTLSYPEITAEYASSLYPVLENEAEWYIDQVLASLSEKAPEEAKAEEKVEAEAETKVVISEKAPLYTDTLTYKGVTSTIAVDNTWATLTIPEGMSMEDVQAVAGLVASSYKEASLVSYSIDGDTVILTYPEQSDEFLLSALDVLRKEAMALIDRIEEAKTAKTETAPAVEEAPLEAAPAEEAKTVEEAPAAKAEEPAAPAEPEKAPEAPAPVAPVNVEAVPVKEEKKDSPKAEAVRASFNMGLNGGLEWGMGKVVTEGVSKTPTIYPFVSFTLEGQNLLHFGAFGLGLRSDLSAVFIPQSRNLSSNPGNIWGFDATADLKLMAYINASFARFYFGAGVGYSAASDGFTSVHSTEQRILKGVGGGVGFNTAFAVTGVLGAQFNLGKTVTLSAEGYARWFFDSPGKLDTLNVAATVGLGVRF